MLALKKRFPLLWPTVRCTASRLTGGRPGASLTPTPRSVPWWQQRHQAKVAEARAGLHDLALVGDSITHFWETTGQAVAQQVFAGRRVLNLGFDGDLTEHVLWRLHHGEWPAQAPRLTVLLAGTNNNIRHERPADTVAGLRAIVRAIRQATPGADLLLMCLLPRNGPRAWTRRRNEAVNAMLPALTHEENVRLLDIGPTLLQAEGRLDRRALPDQLHPSAEGYQRWAAALLPQLPPPR
jgi:lysophospholipase L1-like esterase